jgi:hypothetical protein
MDYHAFQDKYASSPLKNPIQPTKEPQIYWREYAEQQDDNNIV